MGCSHSPCCLLVQRDFFPELPKLESKIAWLQVRMACGCCEGRLRNQLCSALLLLLRRPQACCCCCSIRLLRPALHPFDHWIPMCRRCAAATLSKYGRRSC